MNRSLLFCRFILKPKNGKSVRRRSSDKVSRSTEKSIVTEKPAIAEKPVTKATVSRGTTTKGTTAMGTSTMGASSLDTNSKVLLFSFFGAAVAQW